MTERERLEIIGLSDGAIDALGAASDRLIARLCDALIIDEPVARDAALTVFRAALGDWMAELIGRCASQSAAVVVVLNDKIERLEARNEAPAP